MNSTIRQLVIMGDSSVYGWGDSIGGGWCERLRQKWMQNPKLPVIYQLGIRGDGLERVAKRWENEWQCRGELRRKVPDGLLLSVGINDTARIGSKDGRPQLSSEAFLFGLERLLRDMKKKTKIMVIGLTPINEEKMPFANCLWYSNKACNTYERDIEETCLNLDIPFLPTHNEMINLNNWKKLIKDDGLHLNSDGHLWMYNKIVNWKIIIKWSEYNEFEKKF